MQGGGQPPVPSVVCAAGDPHITASLTWAGLGLAIQQPGPTTATHLLLGSPDLQQLVGMPLLMATVEPSHGELHRHRKIIVVLTNVYKFLLNGPDVNATTVSPRSRAAFGNMLSRVSTKDR